MLHTRFRKILADVWARKGRTLLVSTSIFIGVFGVVTLFSTGEILINQLEEDIQQERLAMMRVQVSTSSGAQPDNDAALESLSEQPGVTRVEGRATYPLFWKLPGEDRFRAGVIVAYAQPFAETQLEPPRLIAGEYPTAGQNEIAIERRLADQYGVGVGDTLDLRVLTDDPAATVLENGQRQLSFTIAGIVFQPYGELTGPGPVDAATLVYAPYEEARRVAGFTGLSLIYARFVDFGTAEAESASFQAAIADTSPYVPVFAVIENPAESSQIENTRSTNRILVILALVALVVSGFLVVNVINSIVVEQKRQIGVMKSLGATRFDNFMIFSGIALAYGVIGVIPGVLLGIPGGYFAAQGLATQSQTIIEDFSISPTGILIGVLVGLAVPFLASILPVFNGTRVSILEAMTDMGIEASYGGGPLSRLIKAVPMPITLRQAFNNVNRKKFRLALTGTTLTIAVGAFMGIFAVFSSLGNVIDDVFETFGAQLSIEPTEGQPLGTVRDLLTATDFTDRLAAQGLPAPRSIEPGANLSIEIEGYDPPPVTAGPPGIFAQGINTANPDQVNFNLKAGDAWRDDPTRDGVVIASRIAEIMDKDVGDSIVILAGGDRATFEIIGITSYPFDTVWMKWEALARLGGLVIGGPTADDYAMGTTFVELPGNTVNVPAGPVAALGLDAAAGDLLTFVDGGPFTPGQGEAIVSRALAEARFTGVGQSITLSAGETSATYTITGVFELPTSLAERDDYPAQVVGLFWEDLAAFDGRDAPSPHDYQMGTTLVDVAGYAGSFNGQTGALGMTVGPADQMSRLLSFTQGDIFTPGASEAIISRELAEAGDFATGDTLRLTLNGNSGDYTITGIFELPAQLDDAPDHPRDVIGIFWQDLARLEGRDVLGADEYVMGTLTVQAAARDASAPGGEVGALGLDGQFVRFLSYTEGRSPEPGASEAIVNTELAAARNYSVGDTVEVTLAGHTATYTLTGVFELPPQAAANPAHPDQVIGIFWQELAALEGRDVEGELYPNSINIILETEDEPSAQTVESVIEAMNEALLAEGLTAEFTNWVEFKDTITQFIQVFNVILYLAAALIAAVGAIGLLTSLSMSVFERQREIGIMRSVGAGSGTVAIQFLVEGIVVGVVAWAFGVPVSYFLGQGLIAALPFEEFGIGFPLLTLIVGLAGMLIVVTLASLWPSLAAARRTVSDILRYQ